MFFFTKFASFSPSVGCRFAPVAKYSSLVRRAGVVSRNRATPPLSHIAALIIHNLVVFVAQPASSKKLEWLALEPMDAGLPHQQPNVTWCLYRHTFLRSMTSTLYYANFLLGIIISRSFWWSVMRPPIYLQLLFLLLVLLKACRWFYCSQSLFYSTPWFCFVIVNQYLYFFYWISLKLSDLFWFGWSSRHSYPLFWWLIS